MSRERLDDDDFLVDAEAVKHAEQVLSTARHLPLHSQTEIFLHSFGDPTSHCVVSEETAAHTTLTQTYIWSEMYYFEMICHKQGD